MAQQEALPNQPLAPRDITKPKLMETTRIFRAIVVNMQILIKKLTKPISRKKRANLASVIVRFQTTKKLATATPNILAQQMTESKLEQQ